MVTDVLHSPNRSQLGGQEFDSRKTKRAAAGIAGNILCKKFGMARSRLRGIAHGRGALILQPDEQSDWDATYLPLQNFEINSAMNEYTDMVKRYDPNSQLVTIFLTPPGYLSAYLGGLTPERPGPPEAYQQLEELIMGD